MRKTLLTKGKLGDLLRVYEDLEKTLKDLRKNRKQSQAARLNINVKNLIQQLTRSKRRLERKIGNTLLLEKQNLKKRLGNLSSTFASHDKHY